MVDTQFDITNPIVIGFTGTRHGMQPAQLGACRDWLTFVQTRWGGTNTTRPVQIVHGGCVGADDQFHELCLGMGIHRVDVYPSTHINWRAPRRQGTNVYYHKPRPPLVRNVIIAGKAHMLIATPGAGTQQKGGTAFTVAEYRARYSTDPLRVLACIGPQHYKIEYFGDPHAEVLAGKTGELRFAKRQSNLV